MTAARPASTGLPPRATRPRDAAASKQALLQAAQDLFGQRGFEQTTIREIGDRAGVDAALIARYFGSKADLYIAAVVAERMDGGGPAEYEGLAEMAEVLITRSDRHGPGPILQALIRSDTSEEIRTAARARLARKLVDPLAEAMAAQGVDRPRLRAELAVAALIGVNLGRSQGWFEELQAVSSSEVVALLTEALGPAIGANPGRRA
jgi:AcrR family transcriptional regulator